LVGLAVTVNITEAVAAVEVFQEFLTLPTIIWFLPEVVAVQPVLKVAHKLGTVVLVVHQQELLVHVDLEVLQELMRLLLPVELVEQVAFQVLLVRLLEEELEEQLLTISELVVAVVVTV
jgi:hypothetical protein